MRVCFIGICAFLSLSIFFARAEEKGDYSVSIAFSQNVPLENGVNIIENMMNTLKDASKILYDAIGLQFSKVTFEIPESLNVEKLGDVQKSFSSYSTKADILIDNAEDSVFGKFPFAQQYGSCGIPGHQMIVPTAFFNEANSFPKGLSIAREWLKYRYGVFDENGYLGDPLYPLYYHTPGGNGNEVHITDCTNTEIAYDFVTTEGENDCPSDKMLIDNLDSSKCKVLVNDSSLENVTSSFMYFQEKISDMTHICGMDDDHKHNSRSPNKQNLLCFGKSIGAVIQESSDIGNKGETKELSDTEFVFLQKMKPRVVVAWENTQKMKDKSEIILNAITKLIIDLPYGSKFSAFPFAVSKPKKNYTLNDLNEVKDKQTVTIGIKSEFQTDEDGNYKDAIVKASEILQTAAENKNESPGNIITITGTAEELIIILLTDFHVCSSVLSSIPDDRSTLKSQPPCLEVVRIPLAHEPESIFKQLTETMGKFCPSKVEDKLTETLKVQYLENGTALSVDVDDFTETVTFWIFSQKEEASFELRLNGEKIEDAEDENYGNVLKLSYSIKQAGNLALSYRYTLETPFLTEIQKTSKAGKYFTGEVIVQDTTKENDTSQMPVIIYAIVHFGSYPVQKALVYALVEDPDKGVTTLKLNDDGLGDPDITENDGVYSRYFTNFTRAGDYFVKVVITPRESSTTYGADQTAGYSSCCGSSVEIGTSKLSNFEIYFGKGFTAKSGRPEDGYKPSRITDLRIAKVEEDGITLKWTAPGEEADSGTASRYAIKVFCGEGNTTECDILKAIQIVNMPPPLNHGKEQLLKIKIVDKTQMLSIAIVAFSGKNKTSDLSNQVEIFRPKEIFPEIVTKKPIIKTSQASKTGLIVGWVIGGILIIVCILVVVIHLIKKQRKNTEQCNNIPPTTEVNSDQKTKWTFQATDIPMKTVPVTKMESFPVLLYTHDQIKDYKNKENDLPVHKSNVPPKQWKSLDVISNLRKEDDRDTKSLESSSTINLEDSDKIRTPNDNN